MSSPDAGTPARRLGAFEIGCLLAVVLACRVLATQSCAIYDDAFITYRYARNLAEGHGLVFNPGEPWEPVLGTTTTLYALVLAGCSALGLDLVRSSLAINALCDLVTASLIVRALGRRPLASTVAVLALAALPHLARVSVGGMESPLFAALALAAATSFAARRPMLAGLFAALVCLVRPEGVLLVGILSLESLRRPRDLVRLLVPVAVVGGVATLLLALTYGDVVPQSVHAKSAMQSAQGFGEILRRWKSTLLQAFAPGLGYVVGVPFVVLGLVRVARTRGAARSFSFFALAITASYLAARPHLWGWYFYVPLVAWAMWLGAGVERVVARFAADGHGRFATEERGQRFARARAYAVPAFALLTVGAVAIACRSFPTTVRSQVYGPLQHWARETSKLHPRARLLAADIGAIGYAWKGTVLDSEGLTWPQALDYRFPNAIIEAVQPEYLLIVAEAPRLAHFYGRPEIRENYCAIGRFSASGETALDPPLESVSPVWVQDYLLYRRRDF